jgi:hypothetical protein
MRDGWESDRFSSRVSGDAAGARQRRRGVVPGHVSAGQFDNRRVEMGGEPLRRRVAPVARDGFVAVVGARCVRALRDPS